MFEASADDYDLQYGFKDFRQEAEQIRQRLLARNPGARRGLYTGVPA